MSRFITAADVATASDRVATGNLQIREQATGQLIFPPSSAAIAGRRIPPGLALRPSHAPITSRFFRSTSRAKDEDKDADDDDDGGAAAAAAAAGGRLR